MYYYSLQIKMGLKKMEITDLRDVRQSVTDVSEEPAASVFRAEENLPSRNMEATVPS
jgi:hypothetical protein